MSNCEIADWHSAPQCTAQKNTSRHILFRTLRIRLYVQV